MIFTEHEIVRKEKANGGKGHIIIEHLPGESRNRCCTADFLYRENRHAAKRETALEN